MISQRRQEKNILREFKHLSDGELMLEIHNELTKFMILTKSEEEATRILGKYGKSACFNFNNYKKVKYYKLMVCAGLINLIIPNDWYDVLITDDDIIERINEIRNDDIKWIDEYFYIYNSSSCYICDNLEENIINDRKNEVILLPSNIKIDEIIKFYNDVITKEFCNNKKLVK